jgi:hypothetical protein
MCSRGVGGLIIGRKNFLKTLKKNFDRDANALYILQNVSLIYVTNDFSSRFAKGWIGLTALGARAEST